MRRYLYALVGGLVVASCVVKNYEVVEPSGEGGDSGEGGESGTSPTGGSTTGGSATGGSSTGGTAGQGGTSAGQGGTAEGGTAGQGGTSAGQGGTSGDAGAGGGCAADLTDCDGECFNLEADGDHCGDCDTACDTGDVCLEGSCEMDCGAVLTQCGNSCVDTDTDEAHCGGCDTPCLGTCVGGTCDLSCPDGRLRCGAVCCALPPTNGSVACNANQCEFDCNASFHDCNSNPLACYALNDVAHCGPSCIDCRQPNAVAVCNAGSAVCSNTCIGEALPCAGSNGKPGCGTWDFESNTTEGWSVVESPDGSGGFLPTAATGELITRTTYATSGNRSLAVHFDGNGTNRFGIEFKLRVCESGQAVNLSDKVLILDIRAVTDTGTLPFTIADGHNYFLMYNGTTSLVGTGDFDMASDDIFITRGVHIFEDIPPMTDIVFWFRVFKAWTGWVYIDNVRILQCTPELCP